MNVYKIVEEKQVRVLGSDHPDLFHTQNNIGVLLEHIGRHTEAFNVYKNVEEKRLKVLGSDHPDFLQTKRAIAYLNRSDCVSYFFCSYCFFYCN